MRFKEFRDLMFNHIIKDHPSSAIQHRLKQQLAELSDKVRDLQTEVSTNKIVELTHAKMLAEHGRVINTIKDHLGIDVVRVAEHLEARVRKEQA